jgi:hypothetical protein
LTLTTPGQDRIVVPAQDHVAIRPYTYHGGIRKYILSRWSGVISHICTNAGTTDRLSSSGLVTSTIDRSENHDGAQICRDRSVMCNYHQWVQYERSSQPRHSVRNFREPFSTCEATVQVSGWKVYVELLMVDTDLSSADIGSQMPRSTSTISPMNSPRLRRPALTEWNF